ncbi:uncharacterized protein LOC104432772 [Eucalyptus grandis]|uniref:uncharacterized protein LOC104432772 n=1 Tax=Eucalyptus grandis TaxID=71139 RepID=UPI0005257331|nr:uncharacterized protein LOC104432772 [Eucalyptus grandis]XP_010043599.1 uncharacterized protein LOC104432772 [Eucalyptus grandis]
MTKEDCDSWSRKCLAFLRFLHEKSKDLENYPAVKTGADDDFKILNGDEINSTEKNCETTPAFAAFNEERVDHDISLTSPVDLAATGGEGSGMVSNPLCSDIKDTELLFACLNDYSKDPSIQTVLDLENNPSGNAGAGVGVGRDPEGLTSFDEFCNNHLEDITILPEVDGRRTLL